MQKKLITKFITVIAFFLLPLTGFSQLSKTHYIPPLTSSESGNANPEDQYMYLSTPSNTDVAFTIIPIGQPTSSYITGVVSNSNPQEIFLGTGNGQLFITSSQTSIVSNNKGYIIEAEAPIYVSVRMNAGINNSGATAQAGALVSKGLSALGTTFRVGTFTNESGRTVSNAGVPSNNLLSFFSILATEDNTTINISDISNNTEVKNFSGSFPLSIILNKEESYTVAMNSYSTVFPTNNKDGLIGALISANKNVVVNCGSANGSFDNGNGRDYGMDQIVDLSKVGSEYIFVKGFGNDAWENVLIVAHSDNTAININGNGAITTINAGEYYLIEGNHFNNNGNMYVTTSEPVFVFQGVGGINANGSPSEANQGMFFVPPLSCETRGNLDNIAFIDEIGGTAFIGGLTIVTKAGAAITINNQPLANFNTTGPFTVDGNIDYITYKVIDLAGNISVQCDDELYCAYFNYNGAATSGSFYSGFPTAPEINFNADFETLGICIPNITLEVANMGNFDSIEWYFDDGSGFVGTGISTVEFTPTISGVYKLIGILDCSGLTLESLEVPVSICPSDIDNDGIIDNIDIDNDNDGILNCVESQGDQIINLSNYSTGTIPVGGYTFTGTINTIGNIATSPFIGATDGTFMSEIPSNFGTPETSVKYQINFNKPLNLKLEYGLSTILGNGLLTDDEEFIIQVPNTKTITLLDPDDQLLVDTNYDGIFESGVTQISSFEIRFKLNGTSLALNSGTFQFLANSVDSFTYVHKNNSDTNSNQATFHISATCVESDTDNDGIVDALDLDSDNDGIPDIIEASGLNLILSANDSNNDGLDNVFDINAIPLDSDSDSIADYLDLDSDNDGIYDLIETGQLGLLSDTNLDGIEDGPTYGINGWADAAETAPDSGFIGYVLADTDSDSSYNYFDLDSDGDLCSDVIEAGFSDANNDDYLGDVAPIVNQNGLVSNAIDGYTIPNNDYLIFAPILIETQPVDTESCELSDTLISVSSSTSDTYQWEVSTDGVNWTSLIDDALYSGSQTNSLLITATPLIHNTYKYRSFLNRVGNTCGIYTDEITLTVILLPIARVASTMILCDNDNNGTMPFDLVSQDSFINTVPGMTITYHASQSDADLNLNALISPFESTNTTIYARVENDSNTTCFDTSTFNLEVYESPFPLDSSTITDLSFCDNTTFGTDIDGFIIFDLTQKETEILNGQLASDFTLTYFRDVIHSNEILTPNSFKNETINGQTIYIRMTNNLENSCFSDTSFEIEVYALPEISIPTIYLQCDDATNDNIASFNLTQNSIQEEIYPNHAIDGIVFTYYLDPVDADAGGTPTIPDPANHTNSSNPESVWIRVQNPDGCHRVVEQVLTVQLSSIPLDNYNPTSIYQCDDGTDIRDGVATFNLTPIHDHIRDVIFNTATVTVNFYESLSDAELENNPISNIDSHQNNSFPNSQTIWVRVKNDLGNTCLGLKEFDSLLNVEALPYAYAPTTLKVCDNDQDNSNPFSFITTNVEAEILNGQSLTNVTITYFNQDGSLIGTSLPNPFSTSSQTIDIVVTNNTTNDSDGACSDATTLEFIIDDLPEAFLPSTDYTLCDDEPDPTDQISLFNTATFESEILNGQTGMNVYYFDSSGINPLLDSNGSTITSPFPLEFSTTSQTVTVMVENPLNPTCPDTITVNFTVNPNPIFDLIEEDMVCENILPHFISVENPDQNDYLYQWYDGSGTAIPAPEGTSQILLISNTDGISESGVTYSVTVVNPTTGCNTSKNIQLWKSSNAIVTEADIRTNEFSSPNNSIEIITTSLGSGDYEFSLEHETDYRYPQDDPLFTGLIGGIYTLIINDKNGCGQSIPLEIVLLDYPKFFTPNNDPYNDTWKLVGLESKSFSVSPIQIFDRFGKVVAVLDPNSDGWDGYYKGEALPSSDYWFSLQLTDIHGNTKIHRGHFSLVRR